jgi:phosphoglycerol transferase MdoB-like AlkP superfamily enzyme
LRNHRFAVLVPFAAIFMIVSLISRIALLAQSWSILDCRFADYVKIFGWGSFFDFLTLTYAAIPMILYLIFIPDKIFRRKGHKTFLYAILLLYSYLCIFDIFAEYYFFQGFQTRFNFIAVDYLVYTKTVLRDIWECYPVIPVLAGSGVASLALFLWAKKTLNMPLREPSAFRKRLPAGLGLLALPLIFYIGVDPSLARFSANPYVTELGNNGIYNLVAAFFQNRIDYAAFYRTIPKEEAGQRLRTALQYDHSRFVGIDVFDIEREIRKSGPEKRLNVIVVVEESLSAEYLGVFGKQENLTPSLDRLSGESLFFTNFYATGTRTDRGL